MVKTGKEFKEAFEEARLVVSDKTDLIASSKKLGQQCARELRGMGIPVSYKVSATDLGIDASAGRSRVCKKANQRKRAADRRQARVLRLRRLGPKVRKVCKSLWAAGVQPQSMYGHRVFGSPPSRLLRVRRQASSAIAGAKRGICLTSVLEATMGSKDPGLEVPKQLVWGWLTVWFSRPDIHQQVKRSWTASLHHIQVAGKVRWRRVRGPVSAVIATLIERGWNCPSPQIWPHTEGDGEVEWRFPGATSP
eukprot:3005286-Pyramimonas_sp.AAC.1